MKLRHALTLIVLGAAPACSRTASAARTGGPPAVPVVLAQAERRDVPQRLEAVGRVEPFETVAVKAQVSGQIVAVHFKEGCEVRAGQLLFSLDPRPYRAALAQAQATLARDEAQARNAAAQAERARELFAQGVLSEELHDQALATADAQQAAVAADTAAVESARLNLAYSEARAPIGGRTGSVLVHEGNIVKAVDGNPVVVINRTDPIYVSFAIPEQRLPELQAARRSGALPVEAVVAGDAGTPPVGQLTFFDNEVDRGSGTIRLKARFSNPEGRLWPGQFVTARITLGVRRGAVVVPAAAVQNGQQGSYVFVVKPDQTAELRPVRAASAGETETVVEQGLQPGDSVVVDGQLNLTPGARVAPKPTAGGRS